MDLFFNIESFSKAGPRGSNQDSLFASHSNKEQLVVAIADGVGGKPNGDIASSLAIETISTEYQKSKELIIEDIFKLVKNTMIDTSSRNTDYSEMATTLTVCSILNNQTTIGHVGDCRIYHLRNNGIITRTKEQTELQKLIDDKIITQERAQRYHRKNVLLSVMSPRLEYDLFKNTFEVEPEDRILLLTDGAWSLLTKIEIRDLSVSSNSSQELAERLEHLLETKNIRDDYSVIVIEVKSNEC